MQNHILNGQEIAQEKLAKIKKNIKEEKLRPSLAVILVGNNPASELYVKLKQKAAEKIGIKFQLFRFDNNGETPQQRKAAMRPRRFSRDVSIIEQQVVTKIEELNQDKKIHGILVQLPLPEGMDTQKIIDSLEPKKDMDGFHPQNLKAYSQGLEFLKPVFPEAIMTLVRHAKLYYTPKIKFSDSRAVIVGNSQKFYEVMQTALRRINIREIEFVLAEDLLNDEQEIKNKAVSKIKKSDIVISACGKPELITGEMIKNGALVIDGGIEKVEGKVKGDIDVSSVKEKIRFLSPVPGGVGPLTISCLLENVYLSSRK